MINRTPTNETKKTLEIEGDIELIDILKKKINKEEYNEIIEGILNKNKTDNTTYFFINKQSACNNKFHLIDENMSPLGDIKVEIFNDNIDDVISYIIN